eukprot:SAG31_NODE_2626_length_5353_cov_5.529692_6_plen_51_part_00
MVPILKISGYYYEGGNSGARTVRRAVARQPPYENSYVYINISDNNTGPSP